MIDPLDPQSQTRARRVEPPTVHLCDVCGAEMYEHSCKIVCPRCGYKRDCTDP